MPLYEYRCQNCGHQFEKIQSFSAPDEKECPVCQGPLERLISAPAIQFKGSGWYVTDYASKSGSPAKGSGDGHKSGDSKSGESKSGESKSGDSSGDKGASKAATDSGSSSGGGSSTKSSSSKSE